MAEPLRVAPYARWWRAELESLFASFSSEKEESLLASLGAADERCGYGRKRLDCFASLAMTGWVGVTSAAR